MILQSKIISFSGSHGIGKSTLARMLVDELWHRAIPCKYIPEMARIVQSEGYPLNKNTTFETQLRIFCKYVITIQDEASENLYRYIIVDRHLVDQCAYAALSSNVSPFELWQLQSMYKSILHWFDYCFWMPRDPTRMFLITEDGVRSTDPRYFWDAETEMDKLHLIWHVDRIELPDRDTEVRLQVVLETLLNDDPAH